MESKMQDAATNHSKLKHLLGCTLEQRRALQVLSVIYQPVNIETWKTVLDTLGWCDAKGAPLSKHVHLLVCRRLIQAGLLDELKQSKLQCTANLIGPLTRQLVLSSELRVVIDAVTTTLKKTSGALAPTLPPQVQLRNAIYLRQEAELLKLLNIPHTAPYQLADHKYAQYLSQTCAELDDDTYSTLPVFMQFQIIAAELQHAAITQSNVDAQWNTVKQLANDAHDQDLAYFLFDQYVYHGQIAEAEAVLTETCGAVQLAPPLTKQGCLHFLDNQDAQAIDCFQSAVKLACQQTKKKHAIILGFPGVCYILALLRSGPEHYVTAQRITQDASDISAPFGQIFQLLNDVLNVLLEHATFEEGHWLQPVPFETNAWLNLFQTLAAIWLGETPRADLVNRLIKDQQAAQDAGWMWYAWEAANALKALHRSADCALSRARKRKPAFTVLTHLLRPTPAWERSLIALQTLTKPKTSAAPPAAAEQRMSWRFSMDAQTGSISPRIQNLNKHGKWSAGRAVALERLCHELETFDFLSAQDKAICRCIKSRTEYYGHYPKTYFNIERQAIIEAIGHPCLFLNDHPNQSVTLVKGEPVLEVHRQQKVLLLTLQPMPKNDAPFQLQEINPTHFRVTPFSAQHQKIAEILSENGLTVPYSAKAQVLDSLTAIAPLLTIHSDIDADSTAETVTAIDTPIMQLKPEGDGLAFACFVRPFGANGPLFPPGQGHSSLFSEVDGKPLQTLRDFAAEETAAHQILQQCTALDVCSDWNWTLAEPDDALDTLVQLETQGEQVILEWPQGEKIHIHPSTSQMQLNISHRQDWFTLDGELTLDNAQVLSMRDLLALLAQTPGRFIRMQSGEFLALTQTFRDKLEALNAIANKGRIHKLTIPIVEELAADMHINATDSWHAQVSRFEQAQNIQPTLPATLQAQLRHYQEEGFQWLSRLAQWGAGACLADDMGLGKTLQALALMVDRAPLGPTLVIAPTSVCANWLSEANRFAPTLNVALFGPGNRRQMLAQATAFDVIVTSYGLLQSEAAQFASVVWCNIVADEAQAFKNALTKRSKAMMALQGDFKIIATGTPVENHLGELWNLFQFINPGLLGTLEHFNECYANPIEQRQDPIAQQRLRQLLRPFILRRIKSDVLPELPARTEITVPVTLSNEERALYEAMRQQAIERVSEADLPAGQKRIKVLTEILRLRQTCCHPRLVMPDSALPSSKLEAFIEICTELLENQHKALVFSQFVKHLKLIREYLDANGIAYQYLDGSTPVKKRAEAVAAFQAGSGDLFLISLKAGGAGLNLTAADYVIHMDPWWNPAVEDQASDRAHRMGQQRPVTIYRLIAQHTIEDKIVQLHAHKRDLADNLLEGGEISGKMSVQEMLDLMKNAD